MKRILILSSLLILALSAGGQQPSEQPYIKFTPVSCLRAEQHPILTLDVQGKGDLRAYFRRVGTADWCMVSGENRGKISTIMFPAFDSSAQIEYFFLLLDGKRVVARSPQIYRSTASKDCGENTARHMLLMTIDCGHTTAGSTGNALGAGYAIESTSVSDVSQSNPDASAQQ